MENVIAELESRFSVDSGALFHVSQAQGTQLKELLTKDTSAIGYLQHVLNTHLLTFLFLNTFLSNALGLQTLTYQIMVKYVQIGIKNIIATEMCPVPITI